jgi:glycine betaine transporter
MQSSWMDGLMSANDRIVSLFGSGFLYISLSMVVLLVAVFVSPLGGVHIGGPNVKRYLHPISFSCVCLCTTVGSGILYWGAAEPLQHAQIQNLEVHPLALMLFHWGFTPYAIFLVFGLTYALCLHNYKQPTQLAACLSPISSKLQNRYFINVIDALLFFSLIAGVSSALGAGVLTMTSAVEWLFAIQENKILFVIFTAITVITFTISALSGVTRGVRILSQINVIFFILFLLFILSFTDVEALLHNLTRGCSDYVIHFWSLSTGFDLPQDPKWLTDWTVYYWSSWMTWAPIVGLFLGDIARGYSVRQFLLLGFFIPSIGSLIWVGILGGASLTKLTNESGQPLPSILGLAPHEVIYPFLSLYPMHIFAAIFFIILCFISFVTAADSNTIAMERLCTHGPGKSNRFLLIVWGLLIGCLSLVTISDSGINGIRLLTRLGGLPALFMSLACSVSLLLLLFRSFLPSSSKNTDLSAPK